MQEKMLVTSQVAKQLGISVATLRKYSSEIEQVTGNHMYFVRNNKQSRMYTPQNVRLLQTVLTLINQKKLPYKEAISQLFEVHASDKMPQVNKVNSSYNMIDAKQVVQLLGMLQKTIEQQNVAISGLKAQMEQLSQQNSQLFEVHASDKMPQVNKVNSSYNMIDAKQVVQLLGMLQKTIEQQNVAISGLKAQMEQLSQQNSQLLIDLNSKKDKEVDPKILAMPDISGVEPINSSESAETIHEEILRKARENQQKHPNITMHRTLADMQLKDKHHWWDPLLKFIQK